jgi:hypothetical protein
MPGCEDLGRRLLVWREPAVSAGGRLRACELATPGVGLVLLRQLALLVELDKVVLEEVHAVLRQRVRVVSLGGSRMSGASLLITELSCGFCNVSTEWVEAQVLGRIGPH